MSLDALDRLDDVEEPGAEKPPFDPSSTPGDSPIAPSGGQMPDAMPDTMPDVMPGGAPDRALDTPPDRGPG